MITYVQIGERTYETEITEHHGELRVTLDGEPCEVSYDEVDTYGQIVLIHGGKSYAMSIEGSAHEVAVTIAGHRYDLSLEDERERAANLAAKAAAKGGGTALPTCLAPCHFVLWKRNQSGKPCSLAISRTVTHRSRA